MHETRVILIGGASNVGKSTLAQALAQRLGWKCVSTDQLGRHPGRPWKTPEREVPPHVADHYLTLSVDELIADVSRHYESLWPAIETLVLTHARDQDEVGLVLEGSAISPERVAALGVAGVSAFWLTCERGLMQERMRDASGFDTASAVEKQLVEKFLARAVRFDALVMESVRALSLDAIDVSNAPTTEELLERVLP